MSRIDPTGNADSRFSKDDDDDNGGSDPGAGADGPDQISAEMDAEMQQYLSGPPSTDFSDRNSSGDDEGSNDGGPDGSVAVSLGDDSSATSDGGPPYTPIQLAAHLGPRELRNMGGGPGGGIAGAPGGGGRPSAPARPAAPTPKPSARPNARPAPAREFPRDFRTRNTSDWSAQFKSEGEARALAREALGRNPVKVGPGKWRSADGKWQYRANPGDVANRHVHLEELDPKTGEVLQNVHLRWSEGTGR